MIRLIKKVVFYKINFKWKQNGMNYDQHYIIQENFKKHYHQKNYGIIMNFHYQIIIMFNYVIINQHYLIPKPF